MESKIAVFIDFDNIAIGSERANLGPFKISVVIERLKEKGQLIVKKAYADWTRHSRYRQEVHQNGIDLIEMPINSAVSGKNSGDIKMVIDAIELAFTRDYIDTFALITGDSDFSFLALKLRELNKRVIGIGVESSTHPHLQRCCDEFLFYDRLVNLSTPDDFETMDIWGLLKEAINALQRENKEVIYGSMIKETILKKRPSFDEQNYGYKSFGKFLLEAQRRGLIHIKQEGGKNFQVELLDDTEGEETVPQPSPLETPYELLANAILSQEGPKDVMHPMEEIRAEILRRNAGFNERSTGYRSFKEFLEGAQQNGVVTLYRDPNNRGGYLVGISREYESRLRNLRRQQEAMERRQKSEKSGKKEEGERRSASARQTSAQATSVPSAPPTPAAPPRTEPAARERSRSRRSRGRRGRGAGRSAETPQPQAETPVSPRAVKETAAAASPSSASKEEEHTAANATTLPPEVAKTQPSRRETEQPQGEAEKEGSSPRARLKQDAMKGEETETPAAPPTGETQTPRSRFYAVIAKEKKRSPTPAEVTEEGKGEETGLPSPPKPPARAKVSPNYSAFFKSQGLVLIPPSLRKAALRMLAELYHEGTGPFAESGANVKTIAERLTQQMKESGRPVTYRDIQALVNALSQSGALLGKSGKPSRSNSHPVWFRMKPEEAMAQLDRFYVWRAVACNAALEDRDGLCRLILGPGSRKAMLDGIVEELVQTKKLTATTDAESTTFERTAKLFYT